MGGRPCIQNSLNLPQGGSVNSTTFPLPGAFGGPFLLFWGQFSSGTLSSLLKPIFAFALYLLADDIDIHIFICIYIHSYVYIYISINNYIYIIYM